MDHYHMRRRYLHAGLAGAAVSTGLYGLDGEGLLEDDPFADEEAMLDDMDMAEIMGGTCCWKILVVHFLKL